MKDSNNEKLENTTINLEKEIHDFLELKNNNNVTSIEQDEVLYL